SLGQKREAVSYSTPHCGHIFAIATASPSAGVGCCARPPDPSVLTPSVASAACELSMPLFFPLTRRDAVSSVTTLIESTGVKRTGPECGERPTTEDALEPISPSGSESEREMR